MRKYIPFLLACLLILLAYGIWVGTRGPGKATGREPGERPPPAPAPVPGDKRAAAPRPPSPYPERITLLPTASAADALNAKETAPEDDLSLVHALLRSHRRALGANPVGLNDEITSALTGKNSKGAASLAEDHRAISAQGELLDRWGTPYRFHAYSAKVMEVRSAGPDRKFFTGDDITLTE